MRATLRPTVAQLVLLELAAACVAGGWALGNDYRIAGIAVGALVAAGALARWQCRWGYQLLLSGLGFAARRWGFRRRGPRGLAGVLGAHHVESVAGGSRAPTIGVVRSPTGWCIPLLLTLDDVVNGDAPVPVRILTDLLQVEDVPVASVRLLTLVTPARAAPARDEGGALAQLASRYLLLTVDGRQAADAVAARGGSRAGVHQILRRCVVRAEELLATAGVAVRRLDEVAVAALFATWLGPESAASGRRPAHAAEGWSQVRMAGTWSAAFAVGGSGSDLGDRVQWLAATAPTPIAAAALVLLPAAAAGEHRRPVATWVLRVSAPDALPEVSSVLSDLGRSLGLVVQSGAGEQGPLLAATMPVGFARRTANPDLSRRTAPSAGRQLPVAGAAT